LKKQLVHHWVDWSNVVGRRIRVTVVEPYAARVARVTWSIVMFPPPNINDVSGLVAISAFVVGRQTKDIVTFTKGVGSVDKAIGFSRESRNDTKVMFLLNHCRKKIDRLLKVNP